jgi:class 3 adenylate cyclase/pimeloyl-ACP methyl ester carboxylesterase
MIDARTEDTAREFREDVPVDVPQTRYAWNGDVALAYQVIGEGPVDLVYYQGLESHVDLNWEGPRLARFLRRLAGHARVIITDRRGWGCSDRFAPSDVPPLETFTDDLIAVMDAAGCERATIFATAQCGVVATLFAATHPDRAAGLILCDAWVTYQRTEETPWLHTAEEWDRICAAIRESWGTPAWSDGWRWGADELDWYARYQRSAVAPGALIAEIHRFLDTDVRPVLPSVHVPTLVFVDPDDDYARTEQSSRYLADRIAGARLLELPSGTAEFHWYGRADAIVEQIGRFLAEIEDEEASLSRQLATVMFTDIVESTVKAVQMGDGGWRDLLSRHDNVVSAMLGRYRGTLVKHTGDGVVATFDGPARGVKCAQAISAAMAPLGLEVRAGLHTGEVERRGDDIAGVAVHIGARVVALAGPSQVLVSQTVKDLVAGSGLVFEDQGEHELKGVPGQWRVYVALSRPL